MFFTLNAILVLSLMGTAYAQIPTFSSYSKFRPSPVDQLGNIGISNFSPADYIINLKAPTFQPTPYKDYQHYNTFPHAGSRPLFTPAEAQFPAETSGQIDNFNKALQEEAQENQNQKPQDQFFNGAFPSGDFTSEGFAGQNEGFNGNGGFAIQQGEIPTNPFALGAFGLPSGLLPASALPPTGGFGENLGKSYVNVQFGGPQNPLKYQYSV